VGGQHSSFRFLLFLLLGHLTACIYTNKYLSRDITLVPQLIVLFCVCFRTYTTSLHGPARMQWVVLWFLFFMGQYICYITYSEVAILDIVVIGAKQRDLLYHRNQRWTHLLDLTLIYHQSFKLAQPGLDKFTPPRSKGARTSPPIIVFCTIDSTSCVVTRPYHTPDPCGV